MDIKEHLSRVRDLASRVGKEEALRIRIPAANKLLAATKNRITQEGRASDGSKIGSYSTKPAYYSRKQFVNKGGFKGIGKSGRRTKTMFIANGYKGFRAAQGLETKFVNMELSGDLMLSYVSDADSNANITQGLKTEKSARKRSGLEKRFKPFLRSTKEEIEIFNRECALEFARLTANVLR